jgi:cytochrome c oxidase assembly protein subunit 15
LKATTTTTAFSPALAFYANSVVAATFALLFVGGLVTSHQAGMAVPDWPLSFGSLNPKGWWGDFPVRLEHGHRLFAAGVGLLVTILCSWVWRNGWPLLIAVVGSGLLTMLGKFTGLAKIVVTNVSILSFAGFFAVALLVMANGRTAVPRALRWVAFAAFIGVCVQATFGGLRVTLETAEYLRTAMVLRILHGCTAQAELCLLVTVAVMVSRSWIENSWKIPGVQLQGLRRLAWIVVAAIFLQLILGATMRHLGAGLAIATFPEVNAAGDWFPKDHNKYVDINFSHTRIGAVIVTVLVFALAVMAMRHGEGRLSNPATGLLGLLLVQLSLGIAVVLHYKPITLTTIHVVNGAAVLALSVLLALRVSRFARENAASLPA